MIKAFYWRTDQILISFSEYRSIAHSRERLFFWRYLYEDGQAVIGIAGSIQVILILLCDVGHQHVHQCLHSMVERSRESLVPGQLQDILVKTMGTMEYSVSSSERGIWLCSPWPCHFPSGTVPLTSPGLQKNTTNTETPKYTFYPMSNTTFRDLRELKQSAVFSTLRSLLLVRKSVEGFKMDVMALASSSCTVLLLLVK